MPLHSITQTCVGVQETVPQDLLARALVVHVPALQWTTTPSAPVPGGGIDPSSVRTVPESQPHAGYCDSHCASAAAKRALSVRAIPIASIVPQQSV